MAQAIALITDSTCDIPIEWRQQYELTVIPLTIVFGEQTYLDGVDLSARDFYSRLESNREYPTTSQPSAGAFLDAYRHAQQTGAAQAVVFTISGAMSGTIASARSAAQDSPIPVEVVDSKSNSMGLGWQVIAAARVRESGGSLEAMLAAAQHVRERMNYFISLDTIEYLARGGRIAGAARFLNTMLQIKPLIYVRTETGTVGASLPARSRKAAIESLYKEFFKRIDASRPLHITVLHNAADEEAAALAERVQQEFHPAELFISIVSPVLGVHTGPRALALCGYAE
jgi:DegV family protein with EDD domain